ncbi:MAG: alkaline phosphatase [Halioglobus sp.]
MSRRMISSLCGISLLAALPAVSQTPKAPQDAINGSEPRHVILIIGDGMDDQQITIARNYLAGATGRLELDKLPLRSTSQILTIQDKENGKPVYVADSANTATSIATGKVTSRGRISTTAGSDLDIPTIVELASAAGFKTGIVTTASVTDATPSAFAAHISYRLCENPELILDITYSGIHLGECKVDLKSNGGKGSIAEQLAESSLDILLGGGGKHFALKAEDGSTSLLEMAQNNGFSTVANTAQMSNVPPDNRLLGLFSPDDMPVKLRGEDGRVAESPEPSILNRVHEYLGDVTQPAPMRCEPNPEFASVPTLKAMTDTALAHLAHNNDRGFFLMVESASIDKQSHERNPCGSIGEVEQLNEALRSALAFAAQHPRTLIMVTADHAQAAQLIPYESLFSEYPIPIYTPGKIARLITPEGSHLAVNYATTTFQMEEHTGANVPLFGNRESLGLVPPFVQQPQLFEISRQYLGL